MEANTANQTAEVVKVKRNAGPKEPVAVNITKIKEMLAEGKTRNDVAKHYGLNFTQMAALFKHKDLKGIKTHKNPADAFYFVDDNGAKIETPSEVSSVTEEEATREEAAETSTGVTEGDEPVAQGGTDEGAPGNW